VLLVTGLAAGRNVFGSNPLRPVAGLPFVGGIEEIQGGEEEPAAVAWHAVLQPPGTVVHVAAVERVASGAVNAEIVLDVARSLHRIEGHQ